jgi:hypothetical protein
LHITGRVGSNRGAARTHLGLRHGASAQGSMLGTGSNRLGALRRELALTLRPTLGGMVLRGRF